jgi:CubicO group peptidase (beta-lactamase class C family)
LTGSARALPARPNLRHLKVEARRRMKSGEFPALYEAQLAIAREHGQPSWAVLKELVCGKAQPESRALSQLRWIISRFADAGAPGWAAPDDQELRLHFHDEFLTRVGVDKLVETIVDMAAYLREEYVVTDSSPLAVQVQLAGWQVHAVADARPPHRLKAVTRFPLGRRITDPRVGEPVTRTSGEVPGAVNRVAAEAFTEIGLPGLVLAGAGAGAGHGGAGPDGPRWVLARGWADLDRGSLLEAGHRFPVYFVTSLFTAMTVLRLVADGRVGLDAPANDYLRTVRLADDSVTVREVLTHTGGVGHLARPLAADWAPDLVAQIGPVLPCDGERGVFQVSAGGPAALGQLAADVTGSPYPDAVARLVFGPLGMTSSSFPSSWPRDGAVVGYTVGLEEDGAFEAVPSKVANFQAVGGLWTTAADLVRFCVAWKSLLPAALAREALRPQTTGGPVRGRDFGLGWVVGPRGDVAGMAASGPGASASLLVRDPARPGGCGQVQVALANRLIPIEPLNLRVLRACGDRPAHRMAQPLIVQEEQAVLGLDGGMRLRRARGPIRELACSREPDRRQGAGGREETVFGQAEQVAAQVREVDPSAAGIGVPQVGELVGRLLDLAGDEALFLLGLVLGAPDRRGEPAQPQDGRNPGHDGGNHQLRGCARDKHGAT